MTAKNSAGNTATGYTGTVHFTSSDGAAILPADYTFVAGDNGSHTFTGTLKTLGTRFITATDTVAASITGSQTGITVNAGPATTLVVAGYPSPTTAGVSQTFTVTAKDAGGNIATGYTGTVRFTSSDSAASLPANYAFVAGDNGTRTFTAVLKTAGTRSITATDTGHQHDHRQPSGNHRQRSGGDVARFRQLLHAGRQHNLHRPAHLDR